MTVHTKMSIHELNRLRGTKVVAEDGKKVGELEEIFREVETDRPVWISIATGIVTTRRLLAPAAGVEQHDGNLVVPFPGDLVKEVPEVDSDELDEETERMLYAHYGLDYDEREARGRVRAWFRSLGQPEV